MKQALHTHDTVVRGMILLLRGRHAVAVHVGVADGDTIQRAGSSHKRHRGERRNEQYLAQYGYRRGGEAEWAHPCVRSQCSSAKPSSHGEMLILPWQNR
jgi:hypothetical protein